MTRYKMKKIMPLPVLFLISFALFGCQDSPLNLPLENSVTDDLLRQRLHTVLEEGLQSEDALLRCHALESVAEAAGPETPAKIRKFLHDPLPAVRFAAAVAAGDIQDHTAQPILLQMMEDENVSVRLAAGYALEKLGDQRFEAWYDAALLGSDPALAGQSCFLLSKLGNKPPRQNSKAKLWQALRKKDQVVQVRLQAAEALGRLGDEKVLKQLLVYASSGYADDRLIAISGLEYLGGPDVFAMLVTLADDPQMEVQLAAIRALGNRVEQNHLERVRKSLFYEDPQADTLTTDRIRGLAVLALGRIGKKSDSSLLYRTMADRSQYLRLAAARATIDYLKRKDR